MRQSAVLFHEMLTDVPETEGIKYAGSKLKLLPHILRLAGRINARTVLDGFAGTTRVSQAFAKSGYRVICNDVAVWSETFGLCYLCGHNDVGRYRELIRHLNDVPPMDGWFTENYGGSAVQAAEKKPWQIHNTRKLDGIRAEIERLNLCRIDKAVALTSLILALDQVDSTLGHYASYLRDWSPRSYKSLVLKVPKLVPFDVNHVVTRGDIFEVLANQQADLAYFDPPYGSNNEKMPPSRIRYAAYYHVWTTVCLNDKPALFGKANRRSDTSDVIAGSRFEEFRKDETGTFIALQAIKNMLSSTNAPFIILSYSSGGRATARELNDAINSAGRLIETVEIDYKRNVMSDMKWTHEWLRDADEPNREFLFLIERI